MLSCRRVSDTFLSEINLSRSEADRKLRLAATTTSLRRRCRILAISSDSPTCNLEKPIAKQAKPSQIQPPPQATQAEQCRDIQMPFAFHTAHFGQESFEQDFASMHLQALAPCAQLLTAPAACRTEAPGAWHALNTTNTKKCNTKRTHGRVKDVLKVATRTQLPTADTLQTLNAMVERRYGPCNK